jgi:hypothetical protein
MSDKLPGETAEDVVDDAQQILSGAKTAVDQLENKPDEVLLRHIANNRHGGVTDQTDLTLYSASVFILQDRGYETDTVEGNLAIFTPDGERVKLKSIASGQ